MLCSSHVKGSWCLHNFCISPLLMSDPVSDFPQMLNLETWCDVCSSGVSGSLLHSPRFVLGANEHKSHQVNTSLIVMLSMQLPNTRMIPYFLNSDQPQLQTACSVFLSVSDAEEIIWLLKQSCFDWALSDSSAPFWTLCCGTFLRVAPKTAVLCSDHGSVRSRHSARPLRAARRPAVQHQPASLPLWRLPLLRAHGSRLTLFSKRRWAVCCCHGSLKLEHGASETCCTQLEFILITKLHVKEPATKCKTQFRAFSGCWTH